ncbi:hypothetical protein TNCV_2486881 [Trichonephila clavipes]|uniref:Tc1-like transposase DDE domain-containing protein n=1 Tax=Trichonephila clavipes TaxID=2585209 RepID=A0A8X6VZP7_TRICX|nr:hypothetical protein TNCV_2486881 [Trichonephila clavipes]
MTTREDRNWSIISRHDRDPAASQQSRELGAVGSDYFVMDDNKLPHRAHLLGDFLKREDIYRMDFPDRSPNLNPVQYACDTLGRHIATPLST